MKDLKILKSSLSHKEVSVKKKIYVKETIIKILLKNHKNTYIGGIMVN